MYITSRGMLVGTLPYMSPEQIRSEPLDGRSDLYSLGVVLHELATGELPVRGSKNPAALPAGLGPIIERLMASDASMRYQTAGEVREAFQRCAPGRDAFERRAL
jgi:serine/threonine-protein kinase